MSPITAGPKPLPPGSPGVALGAVGRTPQDVRGRLAPGRLALGPALLLVMLPGPSVRADARVRDGWPRLGVGRTVAVFEDAAGKPTPVQGIPNPPSASVGGRPIELGPPIFGGGVPYVVFALPKSLVHGKVVLTAPAGWAKTNVGDAPALKAVAQPGG